MGPIKFGQMGFTGPTSLAGLEGPVLKILREKKLAGGIFEFLGLWAEPRIVPQFEEKLFELLKRELDRRVCQGWAV